MRKMTFPILLLAFAGAAYGPDTPGLLVLDDPFSAVDVETETRIIAALRAAFGAQQPAAERATIVLCSQRLAAFPLADRVVVLDNGGIAEQGTHEEVMTREGLYARIYLYCVIKYGILPTSSYIQGDLSWGTGLKRDLSATPRR